MYSFFKIILEDERNIFSQYYKVYIKLRDKEINNSLKFFILEDSSNFIYYDPTTAEYKKKKRDYQPTVKEQEAISKCNLIEFGKAHLNNVLESQDYFYYKYILDNRTRIYVKSNILNYQLNKFVRHLLTIEEQNIFDSYLNFFKINETYLKYKIFTYQHFKNEFDCENSKNITDCFSFLRIKHNNLQTN